MEKKEIKKQGCINEKWAMIEEVIKEAAQETLVEEKTRVVWWRMQESYRREKQSQSENAPERNPKQYGEV